MARIPVLALVPPALFVGLAVLFYAGMQREDPDGLPSTFVGRDAPGLEVTPLGDLPALSSAELADQGIKLVNFWASWCAPCRVEHPKLEALAAQGVKIHGINYKDDADNALAFLDELGNPYATAVQDTEGRTARDWGVYGVPETFVVDGKGKILARVAGPVTQRTLDRTILPAIAQAQTD